MKNNYEKLKNWLKENVATNQAAISYRLPTNLVPYLYEIIVDVQFENETGKSFAYDGFVKMFFRCEQDTNDLVFHINQVDVENTTLTVKSLTDNSFPDIKGFKWYRDYEREFFIANLTQKFKKGHNYTAWVHYTAYLKDDNIGFYRSSFMKNGQRRWLLASQMEPTDARKAFPCFDEPGMKAVYDISVIHRADYHAISNMPVKSVTSLSNGKKKTSFDKTPLMSTYLVGLVVSDFECINKTTNGMSNKIVQRVCARADAIDQLQYSLDVADKVMAFFEKFYNLSYPLPKCDHIAVPDFAAGAMENWGIITYRESRLLFVENVTSQSAEQSIATVISHELAHMWFGDIVSPQWWNDLWLNEGFARFMEYVGTNHAKPDWHMYEQLTNLLFSIMQVDSVPSSHAVSIDVNKPSEINEIFDDITYGKGGSVVRMVNYLIGDDTFNRGITKYLNKYAYGNAIQDFLWATINEQAVSEGKLIGYNLTQIMNTWTRQMGHPLITIKQLNNSAFSISQKHFLLDPEAKPSEPSPYEYKWYVPFSYSVEKLGAKNDATFAANITNLYNRLIWLLPSENESNCLIKIKFLCTVNFLFITL